MYQLPSLGYDYDDLGHYISGEIMRLHHDKHHQGYADKLNAAIEDVPELKTRSLDDLLTNVSDLPDSARTAIRNNGGGHYNHSLFWQWMSPNGGGEPTGGLADAINAKYGSFQAFVDEFEAKSLGIFGSGWSWLQPDLEIIVTGLQDTPIMNGQKAPILGLDVWEHAYYLDYKNKRDDYVKAWWNVVNWDFVSERYNDSNKV